MRLPGAVPEIPVAKVDEAVAYYVQALGFCLDWGDEQGGIAGVSREDCRLFVTNRSFRAFRGNVGPVVIWLNLNSRGEVDELFAEWQAAGAAVVAEPADQAWGLREFWWRIWMGIGFGCFMILAAR